MLKFALIDDNNKVLNDISNILESIFMQNNYDGEIVLKTSDVDIFYNYVKNNKVDVLIMDINLNSYLTGIQLAENIRKFNNDCYIIFETAHLEFATIAYKYKTFDFIFKPITREKLFASTERLFNDISTSQKKFIKLSTKNTIISEDEITFIRKDGMKVIFHTDYRDFEIYSAFTKFQDKLSNKFVRCHKSFIANIEKIVNIDFSNNKVYFDKSYCEIGPKYKKDFIEKVGSYGIIR